MKVLFLTDFFLSGQTTHVLELAKQLRGLGVKPHIAFGQIHSKIFWTNYVPFLKQAGISFSQDEDLLRLLTLSCQWKPDIIHSQSSTLFQRSQVLSGRLHVPYLVTCHGLGFAQARYRNSLSSASAIIAIGPRVAEEISTFKNKIAIIPNGIDTELFRPPSDSVKARKEILYVGRLERKRIEPLKQLAKAHAEIVKSPLRIISNWNPNLPETSFKSWQSSIVADMQRSGIVAACGRTSREALSCGNAVLLMQQGYDGIVSPQLVRYDDFDFSGNLNRFPLTDLKEDLYNLLNRSPYRKKLQRWGRNYALVHLSSKDMAKKTLEVYEKVLKFPQKNPIAGDGVQLTNWLGD